MKVSTGITFTALLALASSVAFAYDPNPLQDFCVGVSDTKLGGTYVHMTHMACILCPWIFKSDNYLGYIFQEVLFGNFKE